MKIKHSCRGEFTPEIFPAMKYKCFQRLSTMRGNLPGGNLRTPMHTHQPTCTQKNNNHKSYSNTLHYDFYFNFLKTFSYNVSLSNMRSHVLIK